jgi:sec-independent protein translocase protein TatB
MASENKTTAMIDQGLRMARKLITPRSLDFLGPAAQDHSMFGSVSFNEIMVILVIALLIFGPKRLPQIGRTVGKALGEFRRASSDLKRTMETEMSNIDKEVAADTPSPAERIAPVAAVERRPEPVAAPPVAGAPVADAPSADAPAAEATDSASDTAETP